MIYFIWSLLNLGALVFFLFICFSVLKTIKESIGMPALVLFVLCTFSFIKDSVSNEQTGLPVDPADTGLISGSVNIKNEMFYNIDLLYAYSKDSLGKKILNTTLKTGFVIGHEWKPAFTKMYFKNGNIHYSAIGTHEWKLLGLPLYSEPEKLEGAFPTK